MRWHVSTRSDDEKKKSKTRKVSKQKERKRKRGRGETNDRKAASRYEVPSVSVVRRAAMVTLDRSEAVSGHLFLEGGPRASREG